MNVVTELPLSNLQRERKDSKVIDLQCAVDEIVYDRDARWSDDEILAIHFEIGKLSKFLRDRK